MTNLHNSGDNQRFNEIATALGYSDSEALKKDYKGNYGTQWNIKYDTSTRELFLVKISDSSITEGTGLYLPSRF